MAEGVHEFTDENFKAEVIESGEPVLVDFWAPWCGPCRLIAPTIEELAGDYAGKARIGKMNTDENRQTPSEYQVSAIPTVILFKNGQPVEKFVGITPKEKFASALDGQLS